MKNLFLEKNFVQKLIVALVIVILFNFASPTICNAKGFWSAMGGALLEPILELVVAIFDGILNVLQHTLLTEIDIITPATSDEMKDIGGGILKFTLALVGVVAIIAVVVYTGGTAVAAISTIVKASGAAATVAAIGGALANIGGAAIIGILVTGAGAYGATWCIREGIEDFKGEFDVATIVYTPFAIFSGMIPMFDINFFNPSTQEINVINVADMFEGEKIKTTDFSETIDGGGEFSTYIDESGELINTEAQSDDLKEDLYGYSLVYTDEELEESVKYINAIWAAEETARLACKIMFFNTEVWVDNKAEIRDEYRDTIDTITEWSKFELISEGYNLTDSGVYVNIQNHMATGDDGNMDLVMVMYQYYNFLGDMSTDKPIDLWDDISSDLWKHYTATEILLGTESCEALKDKISSYFYDKNPSASAGTITNDDKISYFEEEIKTTYQRLLELDKMYQDEYITDQSYGERHGLIETYEKTNTAEALQSTVATWYYNLRNLALVCLLVILVYIGIRIVLSSTAPEKAKYKQMIMNWVIAICILFLLHIIMIATLTVTKKITDALTNNCTENIVYQLPKGTKLADEDGKYTIDPTNGNSDVKTTIVTNFIGVVRMEAGIYYTMEGHFWNGVGYVIMYVMLVVQTLMFTWVYLKRVVYMAFLTIIAPLIAITYPIDKIGDGKAQAFDMWLKEYIFNALLQPIHLLIYTVLCGTAIDLICEAPIYGIVCLAFVVPAEKFIRKMFGFEKAQTPSALGGAAGAALAMSGIQRLGGMIRPDGKDDREADKQPKSHRIRTANNNEQNTMSNNATSGRNKAEGTNIIRTAPAGGEPTPTPPAEGNSTPTPPAEGNSTPTPPAGGEPTPTPPTDGKPTPTPSAGTNPTATSSGKDPKRFTSRTGRAIGAMWDMQKMRLAEANTPKKMARRRRKIRRAMLGGAVGFGASLTMAATKLAMGANASDVITSTTAGATAGYAIGSKGAQKIQELEKMDDVRESLKDGWYTSEERIKMHDEEARKKAKQDPETQALLREAFQDSKERKKFQNEWMEYCWDYGLNDIEAQIASYKDMNSAEFQQKYSGNGITEEEQKAIAVQTGLDIQRYGDVRNDYKKRDEMEKMKKYRAQNDPELQSRAQQMVEIDEANQKAEAASIEQDRNNLKNTMDADNELANLRDQERDAVAEAERKEEEVRKIMEENEALVAKDAQEVAKLEAELQKAQNDMQYYENGGAVTDIEKEIKSQQQIIGDENASSENKLKAERRMQQLIYDKDNVKKKADEMRVELQDRKSKLERELRDLRSRQTQRITDAEKATMEQEVTKKREEVEIAKSNTANLEKTRYGAQLESLKNREEANNVAVKSYEARLEEMATAVAKETMRQYEEAMAHHDAINGNK